MDAVQSDDDPGEVIINNDAVFDEAVQIHASLTLRAGGGCFIDTVLTRLF